MFFEMKNENFHLKKHPQGVAEKVYLIGYRLSQK